LHLAAVLSPCAEAFPTCAIHASPPCRESSADRWDPIQELLDRESEITAKAKELHHI
jgi:hypothetical protein